MEVKKKNKVAKIIIIVAIALILIGIIITIFMNYNKEKTYYATFKVDGEKYHSEVLIEDGYISKLPEIPMKEGYVFLYWEINGREYTGTEKLTDDVTLTAVFKKYEEEKVNVTFNKDNGEETSTIEIVKNNKITPVSNPIKEGYKFLGWYLNDKAFSFETIIEEDITLTAKWEILSYTVKFDSKSGSKVNNQEVDYDNKAKTPTSPTRTGYKFLGWYLNDKKYDFNSKVTKDITLVAKWEILSYTVKFNSDGGSTINNQKINYGNKANTPSTPTKDGYKFLGWYLNDKAYDFNTKVTKDITLIAKWEKVEEKIAYGDVNEDGQLNLEDIMKLAAHINNRIEISEQAIKNSDMNADGKIDMTDVNLIHQCVYTTKYDSQKTNGLVTTPIKDYVIYGDVNEDGEIHTSDAMSVFKYLAKMQTLSEQAKKNADVNDDKKINHLDGMLILKQISGWYDLLPNAPIKNYVSEGDLNDDGLLTNDDYKMLNSYLFNNITLNEQAKKNADVNGDGKINNLDLLNLQAKLNKLNDDGGINGATGPITEYGVYGDTNNDDVVDSRDVSHLMEYLENKVDLDGQSRKNSDINGDGNINKVDYRLLTRHLSGWYENTLPNSQITDYIMYGDVNEDGEITAGDSQLIMKSLNNMVNLNEQAQKNADVNADGKVNELDQNLVLRYAAKWYEQNTLPDKPIKDYVMYGDLNDDGLLTNDDYKMLNSYLFNNITLNEQAKKNADVNGDGKINNLDLLNLQAKLNKLNDDGGINGATGPITEYGVYGDTNNDDVVDSRDVSHLMEYLENKVDLDGQSRKNSDINGDGNINKVDYRLLTRHLSGWYENTLPNSQITDYIMYGDVNEDGVISMSDSLRFLKYLEKIVTLTEQAKKNADVNADGKVNKVDQNLLLRYCGNWYEKNTLPNSPIKDYVMYGDVFEDGIIDVEDTELLKKYLNNEITLSKQALKNADVNNDGQVNNVDFDLLTKYISEHSDGAIPSSPLS